MEAFSLSVCAYCGVHTNGTRYCCGGCEALDGQFTSIHGESLARFAYLDQPNFQAAYRLTSSHYDYQLYVEGMHCSSCVHLIEKLPTYDASIEEARVEYGQGKLFLKVRPSFSLAKAVCLLESLGYQAHFLKPLDKAEIIQALENKNLLKRLAVAGACAGNIMLFVIPVYSGLDGLWKDIFNGLSFFLFLPIVFYSGTSFYKGAWNSLKHKSVHIDLPIAVALLSGFILSTVNLIRGNGAIYFDSTASFIFLILCARYFLRRSQQRFLSSARIEDVLQNDRFVLINNDTEVVVGIDEIAVGDFIQLSQGQVSPVDGVIETEGAFVDVSVLNGEPMPRKFEKGMKLLAGSKILSSRVVLRVEMDSKRTHLAFVLRQLREGQWRKSRFVTLTDRCGQVLIVTVFVLAAAFFAFYFDYDPQEAFNRSLALLVLACPCALALGSPLAMSLAIKKAQKQGILIKNSDALEKVLKLENIFFDKTGTLTEMDLDIKNPDNISEEVKAILKSLEQKSYHPIAFAIRKTWPNTSLIPVRNLQECMGRGVSGIIDSELYEFHQSTDEDQADTLKLTLKKNGEDVCTIEFENALRPEATTCIRTLEQKGLACFVLSGDAPYRVNQVAAACGIKRLNAFGGLSSEQKKNLLQQYKNTCMIGDGSNDALSLQAATVGIAVKGSTYLNLQAADIYFTRGGLRPLIDLFSLAQETKHVLVRNLTFSLLYNFVGGALALGGFVSPLLAAILMPISSFLILSSTLWGLR